MGRQYERDSAVIIDALSSGSSVTSVEQRIHARIHLLQAWYRDGIPAGQRRGVPSRLTQLRKWKLVEHGIEPIGSPNDFTMTHPLLGGLVREAQDALHQLLRKYPLSGAASSRRKAKADGKAPPRADFEKVVSLYHMEREQRLAAEKRAATAEQRTRMIADELAALRREISDEKGAGKMRAVE